MTSDPEPFFTEKIVESLASVAVGISLDDSGSVQGPLMQKFLKVARYYTSLFYFAKQNNEELNFSVSRIGTVYKEVLKFENSDDKIRVETAMA